MSTAAFAESLPTDYQERFNPAQIAAHAHIASGRAPGRTAAGVFPWSEPSLTAICVVTDDHPGLLSQLGAALLELGFEVHAAEAHCHQQQGSEAAEAVDVFWIRDPRGTIDARQVQAFAELLDEILAGRAPRTPPSPEPRPAPQTGTTVRFVEDSRGALSVLEVETSDRSGLLWAITSALYREGVHIVGSKILTQEDRVLDRFQIEEVTGSAISNERRLSLQIAVLSAIDG